MSKSVSAVYVCASSMIGRSLRCEIRSYLWTSPLSNFITTMPSAERETMLPSPCVSWKKRCASLNVSLRLTARALRSASWLSVWFHSFEAALFCADVSTTTAPTSTEVGVRSTDDIGAQSVLRASQAGCDKLRRRIRLQAG